MLCVCVCVYTSRQTDRERERPGLLEGFGSGLEWGFGFRVSGFGFRVERRWKRESKRRQVDLTLATR